MTSLLPTALGCVGYLIGGFIGSIMAGISNAGTKSDEAKDANLYTAIVAPIPALLGFLLGEGIVLLIQGSTVGIHLPLAVGGILVTHMWVSC